MRRWAIVVAAAVLLAGCSAQNSSSGGTVAAPDGAGSICTPDRPCALVTAIARAPQGGTVELLGGDYGDLTVTEAARSVTVTPAADAEPVLGKLDLAASGTAWVGLEFRGGIYLDVGADGTELRDVRVIGSGVFVHGDDVVISGAVIRDGTSIDGIQVGGATGLTVENSWVGGFGQGENSDVHADCVQLFDSSDIVLRGNYFGGCDNAALIFSPGAGTGISAVTVEGNFLQGCIDKDDERCSQGTALDLRANTTDVVVRNNTMLDGSVMVEPLPGLVFDRNIVGYASNCAMPMTNSIVIAWNTGKCDTPDAVGSAGNRVGAVEVADRAAGDLSPVDPAQVRIDPDGGSSAPSGFAGGDLSDDQAGAGG